MPAAAVSFHRLAAQEYRAARNWYARRSRGVAVRFVGAIDRALQEVAAEPARWPLYDDLHRWVKVKRFPYLLIFRPVAENELVIVAVVHASRRPGYWRRRSV